MPALELATLLIGPFTELLGKFIPDKTQAAKAAHELATLAQNNAHAEAMGQIEINKVEAQHSSLFVAGWRPFIGWICGIAIANNYLILPYAGSIAGYFDVELQPMDLAVMLPVLGGLLGLGYLRTEEKKLGVARDAWNPKKR